MFVIKIEILNGDTMRILKEQLLRKLNKTQINNIQNFISFRHYNKFKQYKNKKKIIHILTPLHGNMGDQAIVYATNLYLKEKFNDYEIIEIYRRDIYKYIKPIKKIVNSDDLIVLIGGGNIGNLWIDEERDRRFIIKNFTHNKIISMPQTISFTSDLYGKEELSITKEIYNKNKNLILVSREKKSYKLMKEAFIDKNIMLNPDIVLYLNNRIDTDKFERKYIMTCLRNDKEGVLGNDKNYLITELNKKYGQVINYDTVITRRVMKEDREEELNEMFNKFLKAKVVITDRLHGMVFCAITKTPCIVTKSLDHKVTGTYEWIKELNYIKLVDKLEFNKVEALIDELTNLNELNHIDFEKKYFNDLTKNLKKIIEA